MVFYRVEIEKQNTISVWQYDRYTNASMAYREIMTTAEGIEIRLVEYSDTGANVLARQALAGVIE